MAAANLEIREALAKAEARPSKPGRDEILWGLEIALEQLRLDGYQRVPSTFPLSRWLDRAGLTEIEQQRMQHTTMIAPLIAVIFDELLPQPQEMLAEDHPNHPYKGLNGRWLIAVRPWTSKANTERLLQVVLNAFQASRS